MHTLPAATSYPANDNLIYIWIEDNISEVYFSVWCTIPG